MMVKLFQIQKIIIAISIALPVVIYGQSDNLKPELIGTWEFEELLDEGGNKVDTIWHSNFMWEVADGPLTIYNNDGTYSKQFRPDKIDKGKWHYDDKKKEIVHLLYYDKPYDTFAKILIDKGRAKKDEEEGDI